MNTPDDITDTVLNDIGVSPDAPWLGLRSFTESVRDYFYGRDTEIQELFERVLHRTLTVLFGQSGLGKTSLLQAGLIPRLREAKFTPILIRLIHDETSESLQQQVVHAIAAAIPSIAFPMSAEPTLWEVFHDPALGLIGANQHPVLIFDQFEELFTLGEAKRSEDARGFLESLACLVENRPPSAIRMAIDQDDAFADRLLMGPQPCKVLLSLREDFLHRLERGRRQMPSMMDNRMELRLLNGPQAFLAVYEPGLKRVIETRNLQGDVFRSRFPIINEETALAIVRFVAGAKADEPLEEIDNVPPLLSLICEQLNARRLRNGDLLIQADILEESASAVLTEFYYRTVSPYPSAVRRFVEEVLVSPSGFRESVTVDTVISSLRLSGVADPAAILCTMMDDRLLVVDERNGISRVELTHDILAPIVNEARSLNRRNVKYLRRIVLAIAMATLVFIVIGVTAKTQFDAVQAKLESEYNRNLEAKQSKVVQLEAMYKRDLEAEQYDVAKRLTASKAYIDASSASFIRDLETSERLLVQSPDSAEAALNVIVNLNSLANFLEMRGKPGDAEQALAHNERGLAISEQLLAANPDSVEAARDVSVSLNKLGDFLATRGQPGDADQALAHFTRSLELREQLRTHNPTSAQAARDVMVSLNNLIKLLKERGQPGDEDQSKTYHEWLLRMAPIRVAPSTLKP